MPKLKRGKMAIVTFYEFIGIQKYFNHNIEKGALDAIRANSKRLPSDLSLHYTNVMFYVCIVCIVCILCEQISITQISRL